MKRHLISFRTFVIMSLVFVAQRAVCDEEFMFAVGTSSINYFETNRDEFAKASAVHLKFLHENGMSADSVFIAIDSGKVQAGIAGVSFKDLVELVKSKGYAPTQTDKIKAKEVGREKVMIISYRGGAKALSKMQLKGLLTGEIKNWKSINGDDVPVKIVLLANTTGAQSLVKKQVLDGQDIDLRNYKMIGDAKDMCSFVGETKGALGITTSEYDASVCLAPQQPSIVRPIVLFYKDPMPSAIEKLVQFIDKHPI